MGRTLPALLAAIVLTAGLGGCSLPHVRKANGATTSGPSPYGVWYEQHWATNSVLLAAADQPGVDYDADLDYDDLDLDLELDLEAAAAEAEASYNGQASPEDVDAAVEAAVRAAEAVEASAARTEEMSEEVVEFSNSSPYQFPASSFQPVPQTATPPLVGEPLPAPAPDGPLRY